jgi:hypothetical protein
MKSLIMIFSIFLTLPVLAAKYPCPKEIKTKQSLNGNKKNWETLLDPQSSSILQSVDFYSGHPKKMAQLAPDNKDTDQDPFWTFVPKDEIWQVCVYQDTKMRLIKKLGKTLQRCDVTYNKITKPQIDSIECN